VRLSGAPSAVDAARARIGGELLGEATADAHWNALRHCQHPFLAAEVLWRLSLPAATPPLALAGDPLIDWGGAVRWYANLPAEISVREAARATGGTALCWRGAAPGGRFHPLQPAVAKLHQRLKERFDPNGIFNPGRLIAGGNLTG
jgi:glycolate oxidase FAD binding subunit